MDLSLFLLHCLFPLGNVLTYSTLSPLFSEKSNFKQEIPTAVDQKKVISSSKE